MSQEMPPGNPPLGPHPVDDIKRAQDEASEQERLRASIERRNEIITKITATLAIVTTVIIIGALLYWAIMGGTPRFLRSGDEREILSRLEKLEYDFQQLADEAAHHVALVNSLLKATSDGQPNLQLAELKAQLDAFTERMNQVDAAIVENPTKALSVPLLRRDLENLTQSLSATRGEVDRVYDLSKWFIGLMITMAIGILGLAIGNLLKAK